MNLSNQAKTVIMLGVVLLLVYFLYNQYQPVENDGSVNDIETDEETEDVMPADEYDEDDMDDDMEDDDTLKDEGNEVDDYLENKFISRNSARKGEYKKSSYAEGERGLKGPAEWEMHFDGNNEIIGSGMSGSGDDFAPNEELGDNVAKFETDDGVKRISDQDQDVNDVFDSNNYLPGETNDDWYDVMPEPVSVNNRHLINVTRPIGVNTIGTSNRGMSYDIRGDEPCPKFNPGPFLNSSIEPNPYPIGLTAGGH